MLCPEQLRWHAVDTLVGRTQKIREGAVIDSLSQDPNTLPRLLNPDRCRVTRCYFAILKPSPGPSWTRAPWENHRKITLSPWEPGRRGGNAQIAP